MLRSWSGALALAVAICLPDCVGKAETTPSVRAVLDSLDAATDAIWSYDVWLNITQCWILTTVQVGERDVPGGGKVPSLDWCVRQPGDDPHIVTRKYRQVFAQREKRRLELFGDSESAPSSVQVFDGELERGLVFATKTGTILNRRPRMIEEFHDYSQYYRTIFTSLPLSRLLRDRTGTRILEQDVAHPGCVVLESPPEQGGFASFGVRVWLDPAFGFLPKWVECYKESMDVLYFALVVNEFREVEPGVWAPIDGLAS